MVGDTSKRGQSEGKSIPDDQVIDLLRREMLRYKSTQYLIIGFPKTLNQAILFETTICEFQAIIYITAPDEVLIQRTKKHFEDADTSIQDDETLKQRLEYFKNRTKAALDYYDRIGKVKNVDCSGSISDVFKLTMKAVLPQIYFAIGPKASGKTAVTTYLAERTNMLRMDFESFASMRKFSGFRNDPDLLTRELIKELHRINSCLLYTSPSPRDS